MSTIWRMSRRSLLGSTAALGSTLILPGKAPAQGGAKPFAGTTLNISSWSAPYAKWLQEYLPEFTELTGIEVNYDTPGFAVYNQQVDLELSTGGSAYDVANITFIYTSRWIGAGWFTPLDDFYNDPNKTPDEFDAADFLNGTQLPMRDAEGRTYGFSWVADAMHAGASRFDIMEEAGFGMPKSFDELMAMVPEIHKVKGVSAFTAENHHGWIFPPIMQAFGGNVFVDPPHNIMPALDTPEVHEASRWYVDLQNNYGPDGWLAQTYDQTVNVLKQGRANYCLFNQPFLMQMGAPDSKTKETCAFAMYPEGPKGTFPGLAVHGWGIPTGARNKDASWEFIKWAVGKDLMMRMLEEKGYGAVTRRSVIESPKFKEVNMVNGYDVGDIYLRTIGLAEQGHMAYRTVHVYPQANAQINKAIEMIASGQATPEEAWRQAQENAIADIRRAGVDL
ncbi:MAG: extracellular solute-binding protein [Geminicoccaceae bacterium]|nr:extracellular solute-binding protein [Geminicoccaceae bacterium]